ISLGYPIKVDGKFVGAASANITLTMMSHFLDTHRASRNSITVIAHRLGDVIAHPIAAHGVRHEGGKIQVTTLTELDEPQVVEAVHQRGRRPGRDRFTFDSQGQEYIAEFAGFPSGFGKDWEVLVVTPTDDFVGGLKETNRKLLWMMAGLALVESLLIYFMARRLSGRSRSCRRRSRASAGWPSPSGCRPARRSARSPSWSAPRHCSTTRCARSRCSCRSGW